MDKRVEIKKLYLILFIVVVFVLGTGTTYAYWTATTSSTSEAIKTESTIYSINMEILPLYNDFSFIPMNDNDAVKALKRGCKDKYDRGACAAYKMRVFGYSNTLGYVSGYMDITTNNMINLSYMMYMESDTYDEDNCVSIEDKNYCKVLEPNHMGDGKNLTLGDKYDVAGTESVEFILLLWLTNLDERQNEFDIGNFNAVVTMQAGSGGEIKGVISSAINVDNSEDDDNSSDDNGALGDNTEGDTEV